MDPVSMVRARPWGGGTVDFVLAARLRRPATEALEALGIFSLLIALLLLFAL
jgi:putative copper export protein